MTLFPSVTIDGVFESSGVLAGIDARVQEALAGLQYESGPWDVTANISNSDWIADGMVLQRHPGRIVTLTFAGLERVATQGTTSFYTLPSGFRPSRTGLLRDVWLPVFPNGRVDIDQYGNMRANWGVDHEARVFATLMWTTPDDAPSSPPGTAVTL